MAEFEGDLNLNVETSEIEIKGKFKLTGDELDRVSGGTQTPKASEIPSTLAPGAEASSGPLDLGLKSEYKDNFNMPNQVQWEHFDLER